MSRVLVLAGRGRYEDPWHDHAATSHRVATLLGDAGHQVTVRSTFLDAFSDLARFDLVVVNAGRGRPDPTVDGDDGAWAPVHSAVHAYAASGGALLGLHQAANTFPDSPFWRALLGGAWVPGRSWHPPLGEAVAVPVRSGHPVTPTDEAVTAVDERYCGLVVEAGSEVLLTQRHQGVDEPVVWASGAARAAYDALGHDVRSYDSPSRRALLVRIAAWLTDPHG